MGFAAKSAPVSGQKKKKNEANWVVFPCVLVGHASTDSSYPTLYTS